MLKWLKETLLVKPKFHTVPEAYQYPRLANYISPEDDTIHNKIQEINNRREYMLVLCEEMLSRLDRIRKETKSLDLRRCHIFGFTKSEAKLRLLDHLFTWVFHSCAKITKTTFIAGLFQILSAVFDPRSDLQPFSFFKIVYELPEISEESLYPQRGERIPYWNCYIYMRLYSLVLDNLYILNSLTLSIKKTQLSHSDLQNLENSEFLKRVDLFDQKLALSGYELYRLKWLKDQMDFLPNFPKNEVQIQGALSEKLQTSLEQETISMETCRDLLDFVFDPVKGQKRVAKFVSYCGILFKVSDRQSFKVSDRQSFKVSDRQSFNALHILYLASKCESPWLGELMKQIVVQMTIRKVIYEWNTAERMDLMERANFCEEVLKDWSDNFASSILFELSYELRFYKEIKNKFDP